jgi:hypothetical protein
MSKILETKKGETILVDDEDYPVLSRLTWFIDGGYAQTVINGKKVRLHHIIKPVVGNGQPRRVVDHIDRNPLNNTKENLRFCSVSQNCMNSKRASRNGYTGVFQGSKNSYRAMIGRKRLGNFKTPVEAAKAYNDAAIIEYGEFACLNKLQS